MEIQEMQLIVDSQNMGLTEFLKFYLKRLGKSEEELINFYLQAQNLYYAASDLIENQKMAFSKQDTIKMFKEFSDLNSEIKNVVIRNIFGMIQIKLISEKNTEIVNIFFELFREELNIAKQFDHKLNKNYRK